MIEVVYLLGVIAFLLIIVSVVFSIVSGRIDELNSAMLSGAGDAVTLCLKIGGSVCFFSGMIRVAEVCGITKVLSRLLRPLIRRIIPDAADDEQAQSSICMNISSNMLGLGNAATPAGLKASHTLFKKGNGRDISLSLATFLIINTSSVELIPTTAASIRAGYGASDPFNIMLPVLITQTLSCVFGIICLRFVYGISGKQYGNKTDLAAHYRGSRLFGIGKKNRYRRSVR